jgi:hypothetical protein
MIPRILYYFWDHDRVEPDCVSRWHGIVSDGWGIVRLTPESVDHKDKDWLIANKAWAPLSDVSRLEAMVSSGGVYLDMDVELLKSPDHLLDKAWACVEDPGSICNAALGSEPGNPFFRAALDRIREYDLKAIWESGGCNAAGPCLLTALWRELYGEFPADVEAAGISCPLIDILPKNTWYPYGWNVPPCDPFPETVGIHRWYGSWTTNPKIPKI